MASRTKGNVFQVDWLHRISPNRLLVECWQMIAVDVALNAQSYIIFDIHSGERLGNRKCLKLFAEVSKKNPINGDTQKTYLISFGEQPFLAETRARHSIDCSSHIHLFDGEFIAHYDALIDECDSAAK